jgi:hypothetical protein
MKQAGNHMAHDLPACYGIPPLLRNQDQRVGLAPGRNVFVHLAMGHHFLPVRLDYAAKVEDIGQTHFFEVYQSYLCTRLLTLRMLNTSCSSLVLSGISPEATKASRRLLSTILLARWRLTPKLTCCWKPQRSGGFWQSGAAPCSVLCGCGGTSPWAPWRERRVPTGSSVG